MQSDDYSIEFLMKCRSDFSYFCEHVLDLDMTDYHKEIAQLPMQHRYLCVIIPTGHSKTTLFSNAYPLWRLCTEKDTEICLVSSSLDQSMKMLSNAQYIIETNPFFASLLPQNRFDTWNKSQLITSNHNQFYVKPFNSTARGIHPNILIYDDLLRESDTPMDQIKDTFWSIFFPRGQIHKSQHIVVGTPFSVEDLYTDLEKNEEWHVVRKAAVIEDEQGNWLRSLWPDKFPLDALKNLREGMTPFRFEREYMCRPRASGDALYPPEMVLNCLDDKLEYTYTSKGITYIGCDFAMSTKESGDFNVFTVVDSTPEPHKFDDIEIENPVIIRKIVRFRGNTGHIENIRSLHSYYNSAKVIADSSGVGAKFVQELRENQISVDAQDFRPANRNMLLMGLRRLIEQNRIIIPNKGELIPLTNRLVKELTSFRSVKTRSGNSETWQSSISHDDMVMSLALAVKDVSSPRKMLENVFVGV